MVTTLSNLNQFKKNFTERYLSKFALKWILKISPHLACVANVSHDSVATYARCGGIFHTHLTANLPRNLPLKVF